jgi:hypothetical protein
MADEFPFGVYDTKRCQLAHIGLYENEARTWEVFLGWPDNEEIEAAKARGLKVLPLTVKYDPHRQDFAATLDRNTIIRCADELKSGLNVGRWIELWKQDGKEFPESVAIGFYHQALQDAWQALEALKKT